MPQSTVFRTEEELEQARRRFGAEMIAALREGFKTNPPDNSLLPWEEGPPDPEDDLED